MISVPGRWRLALAAIGLGVLQIPVLLGAAADPSQSDFGNYFTSAFVLARGGDLGPLYDRDTFAASMGEAGLSVLGSFIPHPPANALWLLPFAWLSPSEAKGAWALLLLACLGATVWLTRRLLPRADGWLAAVIVITPVLAIRNNLAFGQPYLVLSALLAGGTLALTSGLPFVGGLLLGLGVSFKPYALCLGLLFLHRDRLRPLVGFTCGAVAPSLLVVALNGPGGFETFATRVLPWMVRGDIQDPFSPVWGSVGALANRLFRFEADLNPEPWIVAPMVARFIGAAVPAGLIVLGVAWGRRAMREGRVLDAVGVCLAFALAAAPFAASYHLVLLAVPVAALVSRLEGWSLAGWLIFWAALGSPLMNVFREVTGALTPLAYSRFVVLTALAFVVAQPLVSRSAAGPAVGLGLFAGILAIGLAPRDEAWPRVVEATGYSMMNPHFCGENLRWFVPSSDGRGLESRGAGEPCGPGRRVEPAALAVTSRFVDGSWNLYLVDAESSANSIQLTSSDANEIDPVMAPGGCEVVFASDQGRGLGSTALYRLELSRFIVGCDTAARASDPR